MLPSTLLKVLIFGGALIKCSVAPPQYNLPTLPTLAPLPPLLTIPTIAPLSKAAPLSTLAPPGNGGIGGGHVTKVKGKLELGIHGEGGLGAGGKEPAANGNKESIGGAGIGHETGGMISVNVEGTSKVGMGAGGGPVPGSANGNPPAMNGMPSQGEMYSPPMNPPMQGGYQQPGVYPQGGYQQPGVYPQGGYQQPGGYPLGNYPPQAGGYPQQGGYQQPGGYPQGNYPPQAGGYPQQGGYPPQGGYSPQGGYTPYVPYPYPMGKKIK